MREELFHIIFGILIPFLGTTIGAGSVFFVKNEIKPVIQKLLLGFAVFLLVLVIVPKNPLAITNNNATRWLGTQSFSFQPSEIAKLAVVVYFADSISKKKRKPVL